MGEILYRPIYRGEIVWNKTKKRNAWGQREYTRRPENEWVTVPAPQLRIVSDELWTAVHERLRASRQNYLRRTNGRVWGRPANGVESKYLLTGMAICGACGGGMLIRSRKASRQRSFFYGCAANYQRGEDVCRNGLEIPMSMADRAVLEMIEESILTPAVIEEAIEHLFGMVSEPSESDAQRTANLRASIERLEAEVARLTAAIADAGALRTLVDGLKDREARLQELRGALDAAEDRPRPTHLNVDSIRWEALRQLSEWKGLLAQNVSIARQIMRKVLEGRLVFVPRQEADEHWYEFSGEGSLTKFFSDVAPLKAVASPQGFEPWFQP